MMSWNECQTFKIILSTSSKYETLLTNFPIRIYINRINNRLVFKLKDVYKLESQLSETMKLFDNTKKLIYKTKNRENVLSLEVVEIALV